MRIVHLLQSNIFSGAEAVACSVIDLFREEEGFEMIYVSPDGPIREILPGRRIRHFPLREFCQKEIDRAIRELRPDLIHAHDFNASVRAARYRNVRIVSHLHHDPAWFSKISLRSLLYQACTNRYEAILGVSSAILEEYVFHRQVEKKMICLPNTVDAEKVLRMAAEETIQPFDLLFVGRLAEPKDPLRFLRIVKDTAKRADRKISAVLVGDGPLRRQCEEYICQNQLQDTVRMAGFDPNPYKYMQAARVVLMPSEHEGFGLVAVEAMLLGKVVLGTPVGGLRKILSAGGEALAEDASFVARSIYYLTNAGARESGASRARREAAKHTDDGHFREVLRKIYLAGGRL